MRKLTVSGRTVEEAIEQAARELNAEPMRLSYEVVEKPQKGFLGLFGAKRAVIDAYVKPDSYETAQSFLSTTLELMDIEVNMDVKKSNKELHIQMTTNESKEQGLLIGKKGQTLDALEYLSNLAVANSDTNEHVRVQLDVGNYRLRRTESLRDLAFRVSKKAKSLEEAVVLEPMPARERKVIHTALAKVKEVETVSSGQGARRHVVVKPKR
ncbi:RNA-binding cell elongation regulator Jag/EloR [Shouchella shacheensis]|uniref:RNA-binding cell elongation regulator Jag/EloR n=1 Tax=Shouchella shacheensis TaxID=1649580 RepID=UPI00073FE1DE|nr:RNA-binding cell elongation regulator Jag/EloR [Shouchella shacheensis]